MITSMSIKKEQDFQLLAKIVNASAAGLVGICCVYPLNLVKFLMQNQPNIEGKPRHYDNIFDCFRKIFRHHGMRGVYNGLLTNAVFIIPEKTIKLVANDYFRSALKKPDVPLSIPRQILAGAGAGSCQILVTVPMELLIIRRVTSIGDDVNVKITGAWKNALKIYNERGFFGWYKGAMPTWNRDVFFSMIYFPTYSYLNGLAKPNENEKVPFYHTFLSGLVAGMIAGYSATPFDVIKTRIQSKDNKNLYSGVIDCAQKTYRNEPLKTFMTGALLRIMVIAPLFGILQVVNEVGFGETILGISKNN